MIRRRSRRQEADESTPREAILRSLAPWLVAVRRDAWRPLTAPGEPDGPDSKFCGASWLSPTEAEPLCTLCGRPLQLFVQLELATLPGDQPDYGDGLLQLYYCVGGPPGGDDGKPDCWAEGAWEPFSAASSLVRVVPAASLEPRPRDIDAFPPAVITGWERFDDLPHPEDHAAAGLVRSFDFQAKTLALSCTAVDLEATIGLDDLQVEDIAIAAEKDKLAGWPYWIQSNEQPACPTCGTTMRVVLQLDSGDHVPFMFGDAGIGHITQCPTHHDVVTFGWACS